MRIRREEGEEIMAVSGGFLQVNNDRVQILTDAAERAEEIDETRAEAARQRAQQILAENPKGRNAEVEEAEIALRKSLARLKVANLRRRRGQRHDPNRPAPDGLSVGRAVLEKASDSPSTAAYH